MNNEKEIVPANQNNEEPGQYTQSGNGNTMIPNFGTINIYEQPQIGGPLYIPSKIDEEYYNLFVIKDEKFDQPYLKIPCDRALTECMDPEDKILFSSLSPDAIDRIKTMPSLFMEENNQFGQADDDQHVIYGFVSKIRKYEKHVKVFYSGYRFDIPQQQLNELLEELALIGNQGFNELNRTHWSIKHRNLIQELLDAGIQVPNSNCS